jgi:hypothetical protein
LTAGSADDDLLLEAHHSALATPAYSPVSRWHRCNVWEVGSQRAKILRCDPRAKQRQDLTGSSQLVESSDNVGIIVAGKSMDNIGYVLADRTCKPRTM